MLIANFQKRESANREGLVPKVEMGTRVRAAREARGWSMERLAREADVGYQSVHRLEHGQGDPRLNTLRAVLAALGMALEVTG